MGLLSADEMKLFTVSLFVPLSISLHRDSTVTTNSLFFGGQVGIADRMITDPERQIQSAGVAHSQPDELSVGHLGSLFDPSLLVTVSDGDQVTVVLSAVSQGLIPSLLHFDQDHFVWH